jgi:mannitol/fructose-specific phosphotransferase system IIA component (Ntr-type)
MELEFPSGVEYNLKDMLLPERVIPNLKSTDKKSALNELINLLKKLKLISDADMVQKRISERENLETTALGNGIAFPHARLEFEGKVEMVIGRSQKGIDFGAPDGVPVHVIFLAVWQPEFPGLLNHVFGSLIQYLRDPDVRKKLFDANNSKKIIEVLSLASHQSKENTAQVNKAKLLWRLQEIEREKIKGGANIRSLERKASLIRSEIDEAILNRFDRMISRTGTAIVEMKNGACQNCFMRLSTGFHALVKRGMDVYLCENCGKFIIDANG